MFKNSNRFLLILIAMVMTCFIISCQGKTDTNQLNMEKELKTENTEFDKCVYSLDSVKKIYKIEFHYENDTVFSSETQKAIRDGVVQHLAGQYSEDSINIFILSDQSPTIKQYQYANGKWDKEIS